MNTNRIVYKYIVCHLKCRKSHRVVGLFLVRCYFSMNIDIPLAILQWTNYTLRSISTSKKTLEYETNNLIFVFSFERFLL